MIFYCTMEKLVYINSNNFLKNKCLKVRSAFRYFYIPGKYLYERNGSVYKKFLDDLFVCGYSTVYDQEKGDENRELSYSKWKKNNKNWEF